MMATHSLAIAKASLAAGMMRPDPTSVPRTEISQLHVLLENSLHKCSPSNIQLCKDWLLRNTLPSASRTLAFGKYLVALSVSLGNPEDERNSDPDRRVGPSSCRKQLHILYLLNDLLHHTKYHLEESSVHISLRENVQTHLLSLVGIVSAYDPAKFRSHRRKIDDLLDLWAEKCYFDTLYVQKLRETVKDSPKATDVGDLSQSQFRPEEASGDQKANAPYLMPPAHGDPSTPYYDLPAGNMMPHIIPNSATPINPQLLKPLQLNAGPAEESLVNALRQFMDEIDPIVSPELDETCMDIDELGNLVSRDPKTGELIGGDGYYGWSRVFCERMKRKNDGTHRAMERMRHDQSASRSSSPRKRRRYSYSENSGGWEKSRSRSTTSSRSGSAGRRRSSHDGPRGRSYSRSRSRDKPVPSHNEYGSSRARSRSTSLRPNSYSPPSSVPELRRPQAQTTLPPPLLPVLMQGFSAPPPPSPSFQQAYNQGFPPGTGRLPNPPPRPPNYQGPWPPPPPPLPPHHTNLPSVGNLYPPFPPFGPQHPSPFEYAGQGQQPMHGAWPQPPQPGKPRNYAHSNAAAIPPSLNGRSQNNGPRTNRGNWA